MHSTIYSSLTFRLLSSWRMTGGDQPANGGDTIQRMRSTPQTPPHTRYDITSQLLVWDTIQRMRSTPQTPPHTRYI